MKIRVIKSPEYITLCHFQVKPWWFPFWITRYVGTEKECLEVVKNYLDHGDINKMLFKGKTK